MHELGQELHKRLATFAAHLGKIGKGLTSAVGSYNEAVGSFESRVYGAGPILSYTVGNPANGLTFIGKYYQEFDAENTFEGHTFDLAFTAKF